MLPIPTARSCQKLTPRSFPLSEVAVTEKRGRCKGKQSENRDCRCACSWASDCEQAPETEEAALAVPFRLPRFGRRLFWGRRRRDIDLWGLPECPLKIPNAAPQCLANLGEPTRAEDDQTDNQNDQEFRKPNPKHTASPPRYGVTHHRAAKARGSSRCLPV